MNVCAFFFIYFLINKENKRKDFRMKSIELDLIELYEFSINEKVVNLIEFSISSLWFI